MRASIALEQKGEPAGIIPFVTEVARYFMDFLETDFHKVRNPKRHIQYRNSNNLQICINLDKYKKYRTFAWKTIRSGFDDDSLNELKRGVHTTQIPQTLLQLIEQQIATLEVKEVEEVVNLFENEIQLAVLKYPNDTIAATTFALDGVARVINEKFLSSFIEKIREPLDKLQSTTVDSVYHIEADLTDILTKPLEDAVSSTINLLCLAKEVDVPQLLMQVFNLQDVQNKLDSFFKGFSIGDLFFEVSELVNNKNLLEKQEIYFYFCDITYKDCTYPLFYIPVQIEKTSIGFNLSFDSLLYLNKKAVQFVLQNYNIEKDHKGSLNVFGERIIYLAEKRQHLVGEIDRALKEVANYFGLDPYIDINNPERQVAKGPAVQVTNTCYLGLFDKSDESLVNDYEEILQKLQAGDDCLAAAFQTLIDDFITHNPVSVVSEVEQDWEHNSTGEKLVYSSPVPLNEEQRQILSALKKQHCKYITVEGPPGTGKSHTITAIVCDAILKDQSVLVLSDKKEALDVVEDKITETMNKVRLDKHFQNPILRLGQVGNTYAKILSTTSMERIKEHYKAVRSDYQRLEKNIDASLFTVKQHVSDSVTAFEKIKLSKISELMMLESDLMGGRDLPVNIEELADNHRSDADLLSLRDGMRELKDGMLHRGSRLDNLFKSFYPSDQSLASFLHFVTFLDIVSELRVKAKDCISFVAKCRSLTEESLELLENFVSRCQALKSPLFGYLFKAKKVSALCEEFRSKFPNDFAHPHRQLDNLRGVITLFRDGQQQKSAHQISDSFEFKSDFIEALHQLLTLDVKLPSAEERKTLIDNLSHIESLLEEYKQTANKIEVDKENIVSFFENRLSHYPDAEFNKLIRYLALKKELHDHFTNIPEHNYVDEKTSVEELVTTQMTYKMDERVVDFFENHRNDARTLSGVISKKQRFDKTSFEKLKRSFPCILAGIRDFAEYIPLEFEIFDLVIIDEASQVSIAQAFPALLRGKKIIVLGDKKQFSNVKSAQARSDTNREYLNRLREVFLKTIAQESTKLERLEKFNIKTSILDFFERISNYSMMLKKHFRGYRELISYSSKYFYDNGLQAIKVRAKPIEQVLHFSLLEHDNRIELIPNTNELELAAIVTEVERIAKEEPACSIGIITPHTNQQKLLVDAFARHSESEQFYKQHKLKIMTFDTCQGEERDIILYSMVANPASDHLWGVFIKDRKSVDLEENGQIKLQRLNVGFSRAKERMHFVLSKPIEEFNGSIGEALRHYSSTLEDAKQLPEPSSTDSRSPMETKVLHWLQETSFFKCHRMSIEVHAQFPLGEYLKQLDKRYSHPAYVADFLFVFTDEEQKEHKIIIEYDGFEFHFERHSSVNEFNYDLYHTEEHVYRERVLESYGYKFLRINRFNLGKDPIETLNQRLESLLKKKPARIIH